MSRRRADGRRLSALLAVALGAGLIGTFPASADSSLLGLSVPYAGPHEVYVDVCVMTAENLPARVSLTYSVSTGSTVVDAQSWDGGSPEAIVMDAPVCPISLTQFATTGLGPGTDYIVQVTATVTPMVEDANFDLAPEPEGYPSFTTTATTTVTTVPMLSDSESPGGGEPSGPGPGAPTPGSSTAGDRTPPVSGSGTVGSDPIPAAPPVGNAAPATAPPARLAGLSPREIGAISPQAFGLIPSSAFAALTAAQARAITPAQSAVLRPAGAALLSAQAARALAIDTLAAVRPAALAAMPPAAVRALTPTQLRALSRSQVAALRPAQLARLTPSQQAALRR